MRKWEDIVKDKMEAFDEALPESVFAEFHAIRRGATPAPAPKRFPLVCALVPAVAAGLATVLFLRQPSTPDDGIQVVQQPVQPVAALSDSTGVAEPIQDQPLFARAASPKVSGNKKETEPVAETNTEAQDSPEIQEPANDNGPIVTTAAPAFLPEGTRKAVKPKVGPVAGLIAGGGLVAAVAAPLLGGFGVMDMAPQAIEDGSPMVPDCPVDELTGNQGHGFPLKLGLSTRIPITGRLNVTTGVNYSLYSSWFEYSISGKKKQLAHYVGVPVRLDWTLASNKWLDVYVGGGFEADWCVGATLEGGRIKKDGFGLSLLGAGGVQFNFNKRIGLFVEPEISWTIPSESRVLETYRTGHPVSFSVASGIRVNFGK